MILFLKLTLYDYHVINKLTYITAKFKFKFKKKTEHLRV